MALTGMRWIALSLAACAIIWLGALFRATDTASAADDQTVARSWTYRGSPALAMQGRLAGVNDRLRTLELRDSVLSVAGRKPDSTLTLLFDPRLPAATRENLSGELTQHWTALQIPAGRRTIVAIVIDTTRAPHGLPRTRAYVAGMPIDVFLPAAETNGACVALATLHTWPERMNYARISARLLSSDETIKALVSPCAFYSAFGSPSPTIEDWLNDIRWAPARLAEWNVEPSQWRQLLSDRQLSALALTTKSDAAERLRRLVSPTSLACLAGEEDMCRRILFEPRRFTADSAWRAHVVTSFASDAASFYYLPRATPLGPADGSILSEMVRTIGRDRFQHFWQSPLSAADAFKQATGQEGGVWTREWAKRMYGPLDIAPELSRNGIVAGVIMIAVALAGAALIGARRRVA